MVIFLGISCTAYGQSGKMDLYATFGGGIDRNKGTLTTGSRHQGFYYFLRPASVNAWDAYAGLQLHLLNRFQFSVKFGFSGMGSAFRYQDIPTPHTEGVSGNGAIWSRQKARHNTKGVITTGWWQIFHRIAVTEEYNFYKLRFKRGFLTDFGINLNAGLGLDYSFLLKRFRRDSLWNFHPVSPGFVTVKGLEKQNRNGAGGILAGLNAQFIYKEKKYLKFGVWYHYIPHPHVEYLMTLSYEGNKDRFSLYGAKHQLQFFVEIPIKIYSSRLNKD